MKNAGFEIPVNDIVINENIKTFSYKKYLEIIGINELRKPYPIKNENFKIVQFTNFPNIRMRFIDFGGYSGEYEKPFIIKILSKLFS